MVKPPQSVRKAAQRGLDMRDSVPPSQKAGTRVGLSRANQLASGRSVSERTLKRMVSYFARHEVDKQSASWRNNPKSKGRQAWNLWGGDAGRAWAKRELRKIERNKRRK